MLGASAQQLMWTAVGPIAMLATRWRPTWPALGALVPLVDGPRTLHVLARWFNARVVLASCSPLAKGARSPFPPERNSGAVTAERDRGTGPAPLSNVVASRYQPVTPDQPITVTAASTHTRRADDRPAVMLGKLAVGRFAGPCRVPNAPLVHCGHGWVGVLALLIGHVDDDGEDGREEDQAGDGGP